MRDIGDGFRIGEKQFAWGSRLGDVARVLNVPFADDGTPGWQHLLAPCGPTWHFETISVEITARGSDRPVTALCYELAADPDDPVPPSSRWVDHLVAALGPPDKASDYDLSEREYPAGSVRYHANWPHDDQSVGLSLYGAPHEVAHGLAAGCLWLNWATVPAARPYLAEWRKRGAALAEEAGGHSGIVAFTLFVMPNPARGGGLKRSAIEERDSEYALSAPQLLPTPQPIADRLGEHGIGFWRSGDQARWFASTFWDTLAFEMGAPVTINWHDVLPAKGGGFSEISVDGWSVRDLCGSQAIKDAVDALRSIPGVSISKLGGYDC